MFDVFRDTFNATQICIETRFTSNLVSEQIEIVIHS